MTEAKPCPICREPTASRKEHLDGVHPEWRPWVRRWGRRFMLLTTVGLAMLIGLDWLAIQYHSILSLAVISVTYVVGMELYYITYFMKIRQLRKQWSQDHPFSLKDISKYKDQLGSPH